MGTATAARLLWVRWWTASSFHTGGANECPACTDFEADFETEGNVMALLERVSTLLRANLNDLIDKAEDPEKLLKQLVLDMENQLMQVKTQVAIALADEHLLAKKSKEHEDGET